jgi:hypothetical protein
LYAKGTCLALQGEVVDTKFTRKPIRALPFGIFFALFLLKNAILDLNLFAVNRPAARPRIKKSKKIKKNGYFLPLLI